MLHLRYLGLIGLALAVVACGEDSANDSGAAGTSTGNGGAGGAGTGGGGGSAPEGTQVVTRSRSGMPAAGVSVVAHDASGAVVAQAQTDAAGEALLDVPDGGGVTVVWTEASTTTRPGDHATSVMGLSPNGEVRFIVTPHDEAVELRPPMDLSFNEAGPGLGGLDVVASCRPESMFGETSFSYEGCPDGDSFDLIVFQVDGGGSNWMKWQLFANEPYLPGESKTYDIFPDQLEDAPRIEVTTVDPPADVTQLSASISAWRPDGGINRDSRGIAPSSGLWPTVWIPRTFSQTGTFELCTFLSFDAGNLTRCEPVEGPPAAVDSTTPTLARLASASIESLDPVAVSVELDSGEVGHAVEASLVWSVGTAPDIHDLAWSVYAPASAATTVTLPELPPELSAWVPPAQPPKQSTARHHRADGGSDVADAVNAVADRARRESALTAF